jgi:hypothetical protein
MVNPIAPDLKWNIFRLRTGKRVVGSALEQRSFRHNLAGNNTHLLW